MKLTQIALAVTAFAAGSMTAVPAFATHAPGSVSLDTTYGLGTRIVRISGASALSNSLASVVADNCAPTGGSNLASVRTFTINGGTSDGRITVCTTSAINNLFAPTSNGPFAVIKRDTNGSFEGVGPVVNQSNNSANSASAFSAVTGLGTLLTNWGDTTDCTAPIVGSGATIVGNCDFDPIAKAPHAGLSDVDYNVWEGLNNTNALSIKVHGLGNTTSPSGFAGQGFGVMVTDQLYRAMQLKQLTEGRLPQTCDDNGSIPLTDPTFTPGSCQPSISKEEYAAVVNGNTFNYVANGALSGDANPINLCRRVETSGTQASSNVYFLNNSCGNADPTKGFQAPKTVDFAGSGVNPVKFSSSSGNAVTGNYDNFDGGFALFEGSGTGDARNCMIRRNSDTTLSIGDGHGLNPNNVEDTDSSGAIVKLGRYAIGWISLENIPPASNSSAFPAVVGGWKLIKLDGISPNAVADSNLPTGWSSDLKQRTNVVRGYYDAAPELQMLWPNTSGFVTFLGALKTTFATPLAVDLTGIFQANGGSPTSIHYPSFTTQVHKGTRNGNFCAPQLLAE